MKIVVHRVITQFLGLNTLLTSHFSLHSQCESKKVKIPAVAASAPLTLDLMSPSRFELRNTRTLWILANSKPSLAENRKTNNLVSVCKQMVTRLLRKLASSSWCVNISLTCKMTNGLYQEKYETDHRSLDRNWLTFLTYLTAYSAYWKILAMAKKMRQYFCVM